MTATLVSNGNGPDCRRLILLRHAKSAWDTGAADFDRPLAPRGRNAAARSARWLARQGYPVDLILCSPARRTVETCEFVQGRLGAALVQREREIYEAGPKDLLRVLAGVPAERQNVLLIGHNPGMDELLEWLLPAPAPRTAKGKLMTTGAIAVLRCEQDWRRLARGGAALEILVRPKMLNRRGEIEGG